MSVNIDGQVTTDPCAARVALHRLVASGCDRGTLVIDFGNGNTLDVTGLWEVPAQPDMLRCEATLSCGGGIRARVDVMDLDYLRPEGMRLMGRASSRCPVSIQRGRVR